MDVNELLNFTNKKQLLSYLKANSIKVRRNGGYYVFPLELNGDDFTVGAGFYKNKTAQFFLKSNHEFVFNDEKLDFIEKYKAIFGEKLGAPALDSTNHFDPNYSAVKFAGENCSVEIFIGDPENPAPDIDRNNACIFIAKNVLPIEAKEQETKELHSPNSSKLVNWIIYLAGGLVWGLCMFATNGELSSYTVTSLFIWLGGGIIFGVVFGLIFQRTVKYEMPDVNGVKQIEKLKKQLKKRGENPDLSYFGMIAITEKRSKIYPCKLFFNGEKLLVTCYKSAKNSFDVIFTLEELNPYIWQDVVQVQKDNKSYFIFQLDEKLLAPAKQAVNEKCYNVGEFERLFEELKKITVDYNPLSIYNSNDISVLDDRIEFAARLILTKKPQNEEETAEIILNAFFDEYYAVFFKSSYFNAYKELETAAPVPEQDENKPTTNGEQTHNDGEPTVINADKNT